MSFENLSLIQNHKESEFLKMEGTYGGHPKPFSQTGHRPGCPALHPVRFWMSPSMEMLQSLWAASTRIWPNSLEKSFFLCLSEISHLSVHTHCPVARYYCKKPVYFTHSFRNLYTLVRFPWTFTSPHVAITVASPHNPIYGLYVEYMDYIWNIWIIHGIYGIQGFHWLCGLAPVRPHLCWTEEPNTGHNI